MAGAIQGSDIAVLQSPLAMPLENHLKLDRRRVRFSERPPSIILANSDTTTASTSAELPIDQERIKKLIDERRASRPLQQFNAQKNEEMIRLWHMQPTKEEAFELIKARWVEQGIWKDEWNIMANKYYSDYMDIGAWKHEEPLELESDSETDSEAEVPLSSSSTFGIPEGELKRRRRRKKSRNERRLNVHRRVVRERERDASRPYYQFVYQISREREQIQDANSNEAGAVADDINTKAYENVKSTWRKRGIWNERWGLLPAMSWKHEAPLEGVAANDPFLSQLRDHTGLWNVFPQGPSANAQSGRQENSNPKRFHSAFARRYRMDESLRRYILERMSTPILSSLRSPTSGDTLLLPDPVTSPETSASNLRLASEPDIAGSLTQSIYVPSRRSERLKQLVPSTAKGATEKVPSNPSEVKVGTRAKRNGTWNAKPRGANKRKPSGRQKYD